jgi:hypothetical protein
MRLKRAITPALLALTLTLSFCVPAMAQEPAPVPGAGTEASTGPTHLVWAGPRLLRVDDPPPLYAVTPIPVDVTAAALVCDDERLELGLPVWIHPARTGYAWAVPANAPITAPRCTLEVDAGGRLFVSDHHIRIRKNAPVSELGLPASVVVEGSGGGGLGVTVRHLEGPVRARLLSLTRTRDVVWDISLPEPDADGVLRVQIPLPEEILDAGEYLLALEGGGGKGAVCDQPVFVAGEALVDLEEIRLEPLSETHAWLIITGDGAEDIGDLSLETAAGRLPLALEVVEGAAMPTVRTRVRTGLLEQYGTLSLRMEESNGSVLLDLGPAVAAGFEADVF